MSYGFTYTTRLDGQVIFASHLNALGAATDAGFAAVEAALLDKGAASGQLWTGTHNFSNGLAAATPASSVVGTEVVNAAWVIAKIASGPAENFGGFLKASSDINGGM
ncbi:hypothetical protein [Aquidulcibacter sp.]|uniref:hypothetical protein n=1 Tax=Aquidulcibacter sp. TaxID=2052990 RepID=UPI0025C09747|nr:hypothetical protein [Aquidulcibacter sp.]MCA3694247.1 hypothetical protein [Aquidulcibacter sp.]